MRILLISQFFDPEPTPKGLAFAKALKAAGNDVQVLTGFPNYPGGRVYTGYRIRWMQREVVQGVSVLRVPIYPSHGPSRAGRVLNYLTFAIAMVFAALFLVKRPHVIYVYHPPLTAAFGAALVAALRRLPLVCDIQDLWPDSLAATGMLRSRVILGVVGWCARWLYHRACRIVLLAPGMRQKLLERGVPPEKLVVIYNWCDEQLIRIPTQPDKPRFGMEGKFNVLFAGNMGLAQGLECVLDAAKLISEKNKRIQFVFAGSGIMRERLQNQALERQLSNVTFLPQFPMAEVGGLLAAADVLLVHLKDDPLFKITIPSKTQAYLFAGRPILMAVGGDAANVVREARAGVCIEPENAEQLANAVFALANAPPEDLAAMGSNGAAYYRAHMAMDIGTERFVETLRTCARAAA